MANQILSFQNIINDTDIGVITSSTSSLDLLDRMFNGNNNSHYNIVDSNTVNVLDFTNVSKYTVNGSLNCCKDGITTKVAPKYDMYISSDLCNSFGTTVVTYTFKINNINPLLVKSLQFNLDPVPPVSKQFTINNGVIEFEHTVLANIPLHNFTLIVQTVESFEYYLYFKLIQTGSGQCDGTLSNTTIIYNSELDTISSSNIVNLSASKGFYLIKLSQGVQVLVTAINNGSHYNGITIPFDGVSSIRTLIDNFNNNNPNTLTLEVIGSDFFVNTFIPYITEPPIIIEYGTDIILNNSFSLNSFMNSTSLINNRVLQDGVYQFIICEHFANGDTVCLQNHMFIDLDTSLKCYIINKLIQCVDSNIMDLYNALLWSNDCSMTTQYSEICAIYELINILLQSDGCYGRLDDCNCTDAVTLSNKLSPSNSMTNRRPNVVKPCSKC